MPNLTQPSQQTAIVDENGIMTQEFATWVQIVTLLNPLSGEGSPEGVESARVDRLYIDLTGASGSILYVKRNSAIGGDDSQGWVLV